MSDNIISLENVSKSFDNGKTMALKILIFKLGKGLLLLLWDPLDLVNLRY
jgi:hypothetical protein